MTEKKNVEYATIAPPKRSICQSFGLFLWNGETKELLGRSASSWAKIIVFYTVLYAFLAGFFVGMLLIFFQTLDLHQPKWQNANGLIGTNPGLGFRPSPSVDKVDSVLIDFKHGETGNWQLWTNDLEKYLKRYENASAFGQHITTCSFDQLPADGQVCDFDLHDLGTKCSKEESFGYKAGQPCIILKLNRIFGWVPEHYDNPNDLPAAMPIELIDHIDTRKHEEQKMVWVSCEGARKDSGHSLNFTYSPYPGFPAYYFPYVNNPGQKELSPLVAVQVQNAEIGGMYNIECKIWAKNIIYDTQRRLGLARFELFIE